MDTEANPARKYTLTLSPDYVLSWGFWEAARELLQNSIDQHAVNEESTPIFEYSPDDELLVIGNECCELHPRTLLLGMTDKRDVTATIGQFGEGYKLAMLVLVRGSYQVTIRNGDTIWRPRFEFNDEFGEHVMVVHVTPAEQPINGVQFEIRGVSKNDYGTLAENFLPGHPLNVILDEDHLRKRVFVNGLFVCKLDGLEYGYNFAPDRLNLDRDRGMTDTFEVKWQTARLWQQTTDPTKLYEALSEGLGDVEMISNLSPQLTTAIVEKFEAEHPDAVPVTCQAEMDRRRGMKTQLVPQALGKLLQHMRAYVFDRSGTPCDCLERFTRQYRSYLPEDGRKELDCILEASRGWSGVAPPAATETVEDHEHGPTANTPI